MSKNPDSGEVKLFDFDGLLSEPLHRADAALGALGPGLHEMNAAVAAVADAAKVAVEVTHLKEIAEVVTTVDSAYGAVKGVAAITEFAAGAKLLGTASKTLAEDHAAISPNAVSSEIAKLTHATESVEAKVESAFERAMLKEGAPATAEYQTTAALAKGNLGERLATDALSDMGHDILFSKPSIRETNLPGIDIVTMKDGVVYTIDNKAFTTGKNVGEVSALDKNWDHAIATVKKEFEANSKNPEFPALSREKFAEAVQAIEDGRVVKAVTTAGLAPDSGFSTGITQSLQDKGLTYLDVFQPNAATQHVSGAELQKSGFTAGFSSSSATKRH